MEIISLIKEQIDNALKELGLANFSEEYVVEIPPQDDLGDFSSNISFLLAKKFKKNPKVISQELSEKLSKNNFFTKVENVNGFLNLFLSPSVYQRICSHIISHPRNYGKIDIGKGKIIQFEFASVNPTGPLTIAHGRQAVMGDVIGNIYEQTGHIVQKEMYLNDAGRQIKLLARSLWVRYNELLGSHYEIPEDGYVGEYLIETARTLINKYGDLYKDKWNSEIENLFMEEAVEDMLNKMLYTLKQL